MTMDNGIEDSDFQIGSSRLNGQGVRPVPLSTQNSSCTFTKPSLRYRGRASMLSERTPREHDEERLKASRTAAETTALPNPRPLNPFFVSTPIITAILGNQATTLATATSSFARNVPNISSVRRRSFVHSTVA